MEKEFKKECIKDVLVQLLYIQIEIHDLKKELGKSEEKTYLHDKVEGSSKYFPYIPTHFKIEGISKEGQKNLNKLQILLEQRYDDLLKQQIKVAEFINSIDDSVMRLIFEYRYIKQYSWVKMAHELSEKTKNFTSSDALRKKHDRFLEKI